MKLNPETCTRILVDLTLDVDPSGASVEVKVDDEWFAATWVAEATTRAVMVKGATVTRWYRTARTTRYFCGPDATPTSAKLLTLGSHPARTRVTVGGDRLVADTDAIDVR